VAGEGEEGKLDGNEEAKEGLDGDVEVEEEEEVIVFILELLGEASLC